MMVNDFSFGEVQWVACVQSVLCEGWCSYITILQSLPMLCQSMSEGLASLSNVYLTVIQGIQPPSVGPVLLGLWSVPAVVEDQ